MTASDNPSPPGPEAPAAVLRGARVLLVEDNPGDAELVRCACEEGGAGLVLEHVERLEDALLRVRRGEVDAVLLDLGLPDALGLEGVERLRGARRDLPIVVLTGASPAAGLDAVRAGAQDYLSKDQLDPAALTRTLGYAIERQRRVGSEVAAGAALLERATERLTRSERQAEEARAREAAARVQAAAREQEFETLFVCMVDAVILYGEDHRIRQVNPAAASLFGEGLRGLTPAQFMARIDMRAGDGSPLAASRTPAARALAGTPVGGDRVRMRTALGDRAMRVSSSPLAFGGAVSVYRDVTDDERALEALRASEERFRTVVEAIAEEVWTSDAAGRVTRLNSGRAPTMGLEQLRGLTADDVLREVETLDEQGRPRAPQDAPLFRSLRGEVVRGEEILRHRGTGVTRHRRFSSAPVRDGTGAITGAVSIVSDITERKEMEDALRAADERKNEFLAMLSHELRNPLAPLRNSIYVLERVAPGGEQARRAQAVIERQVEHLTRLVDDLLDVTRITRGKIRLQRERFELVGLVRRTVEDHASVFARNGIALELAVPDGPLHVNGDPTRIGQVIGNLLHNAAKFTPRDGRTTLAVREAGDGFAAIHVSDTGAGIAPDALSRVFEAFVQGDKTLDRTRGGLGLGLALVKALVELHGGTARAHSEGAGRGAEFVVTLPLDVHESARAPPRTTGAAAAYARRVLVIEDNVDAALSLKEALELNEHEVELASTGPEGIAKARAFAPHVVLCDIGLPGMDGYDVARALRSDPALRSTPLVALSGYALAQDRARAAEAGFDRHIAKPPSLEELERTIAELGSGGHDPGGDRPARAQDAAARG